MIMFFIVFILILLTGLFAAAETAFTSLTFIQLKNLNSRGSRGKKIARLTSRLDELISTTLIANIVIHTIASTIATIATIKTFGQEWVGVSGGILVITLLVIGEIGPKQLALTYNETVALMSADILAILVPIFRPFIYLVTILSNLISRFFKGEKNNPLTVEGILQMASFAENAGILQRAERSVFQNIIQSGNLPVSSIATHRREIVSFSLSEPVEKIFPVMLKQKYSHFPIYQENPENVIGIVNSFEIMSENMSGRSLKDMNLADFLHDPVFIPATKKVKELFKTFSEHNTSMVIALDEFGGLKGVITKEDLLKEILGELYDPDQKSGAFIKPRGALRFDIKGETLIHDFEEYFDFKIPTEAQTIGGYLIEQIERLPYPNEIISTQIGKFIIKKIEHNRILLVSFVASENLKTS